MKKAALVTGGAKRIGKAMCIYLAKEGYDIVLHYNSSGTEAKQLSKELLQLGVQTAVFKCDLSNPKDASSLIAKVFKKFDHCSLLINNASIFKNYDFDKITVGEFNHDFATNFTTPFFLTQQFSRYKNAAHIINMLDTRISRTDDSYFAYNISKYSLYKFTKMSAKLLAPKIRVNGICPGDILPLEGLDESYLKKRAKRLPLKKTGDVDKILLALDYLLKNDFVTGECLFVDGGDT